MASTRTAKRGDPFNTNLEQEAIESNVEPVNPETGEPVVDDYERLKANFNARQFGGNLSLDDFAGVGKVSKGDKGRFEAFQAEKDQRVALAIKVRESRKYPAGAQVKGQKVGGRFIPSGSKVIVTKNGSVQVRQKGRVVANLKRGITDDSGRVMRAPPKPVEETVILDQDAFDASLYSRARSESDDFFKREKGPTRKQVNLAQLAMRELLGVE